MTAGPVLKEATPSYRSLPVTQSNPEELLVAPAGPLLVGNCEAANCAFLGDVGELVLFDRGLTSEETARTVAYLTHKWSLVEPTTDLGAAFF